jgi:hypothetical protein
MSPSKRREFSLVPPGEFYRCFIPNQDARVWLHGYALVVLTREGAIESLPERIAPHMFVQAVNLAFTDWQNEGGIPEDFDALLRNFILEFADGRIRIAPPKGPCPLPKGPLSL